MTRENALEIIQNEKLHYFNWFDDHNIQPNEVGISEKANKWKVYTSDERAKLSHHILFFLLNLNF
jgi:hypothetical protein